MTEMTGDTFLEIFGTEFDSVVKGFIEVVPGSQKAFKFLENANSNISTRLATFFAKNCY